MLFDDDYEKHIAGTIESLSKLHGLFEYNGKTLSKRYLYNRTTKKWWEYDKCIKKWEGMYSLKMQISVALCEYRNANNLKLTNREFDAICKKTKDSLTQHPYYSALPQSL